MAQDFRNDLQRVVGGTPQVLLDAGNYDAVIGIRVANILTTTVKVDVYVVRSSANYYLCKNTPIPPGGSIELIQGGAKIVMADGDDLYAVSSDASSLDIVTSYIDTISS